MTTKTYEPKCGLHEGDKIQFNPRVTHHNSGETYVVGGIIPQGVLVKRMGDLGEGGVLCPIEEILEVK
jgi:hypothetical protein